MCWLSLMFSWYVKALSQQGREICGASFLWLLPSVLEVKKLLANFQNSKIESGMKLIQKDKSHTFFWPLKDDKSLSNDMFSKIARFAESLVYFVFSFVCGLRYAWLMNWKQNLQGLCTYSKNKYFSCFRSCNNRLINLDACFAYMLSSYISCSNQVSFSIM